MQIGVAELKARLGMYLARVQAGEELTVADRGTPVARIVPVNWQRREDEDGLLLDLLRRGILRLGQRSLSERFCTQERPDDREAGVRTALEDERLEGR